MKIDFTKELTTIEGEPLKPFGGDTVLTLGKVAVNALLGNPPQGQKPDTQEEMLKSYDLALRIQKSTTPIDITIDEAKKLKDKVAQNYNALVYGQVYHILEG